MIDSNQLLKKFGKITECEIDEANPEVTNIKACDVSKIFPTDFMLYKHQIETIDATKAGNNVLLVAGTNSGKTEAAFLSISESITPRIAAQALFIYPVKALAADQKIRLDQYCSPYGLSVCVFDADNNSKYDEIVCSELLLTNPHMLLIKLKNSDPTVIQCLRNLQFVILDEIHCYTAYQINLMFAMMKFIQDSLNINFQLILLSATVGNPEEINQTLTKLFKRNSTIVKGRTKHPSTKIQLLSAINPRILYSSYLVENEIAVNLVEKYAFDNCSTLVFNDTKKDAAMIGQKAHVTVGNRVATHYSSMLKDERTKNEQDFRSGKIPVMVTVKTLQQGIDIGSVQRIVHVGLPYKQTDFWQRQGRMGRREDIEKCESVILPSPKVAFDMFVVSEKERFQEFMTKRVEKILLKHDGKIIKMFMGCMKIKWNLPLEQYEIDFLKTNRLITPKVNLNRVPTSVNEDYCLTDTGRKFIYTLNFYTGSSVKVKQEFGGEVPMGNLSLVEVQPNSILFNNNIRYPQFYVVKNLDLNRSEAIVSPIEKEFSKDVCSKIKNWTMFSQTSVDFSMTNPDSTFGNIILKPNNVHHFEYVVGIDKGKRKRQLRLIDEYKDVCGQDEFLSNYVLSSIPMDFLKSIETELEDINIIGVIIDAAFSCIRNGLRSKFDIAYDEFAHILTVIDEDNLEAKFIFYETSCSDTIRDMNWVLVSNGAKEFLKFVQKSDTAGLFYLRGSHSYFKLIDDFGEEPKKATYKWIEKSIDIVIKEIVQKLELAKKVCENEKQCQTNDNNHVYSTMCKKALDELLIQNPELKDIYNRLVVFYVDNYIACNWPLQNITIAAARSSQIENRYVMFVSIPALIKLSDSAVTALMLHELTHLQNIEESRPFQNDIEEEVAVHERVNKEARTNRKIKDGTNELNKYLSQIQNETKYSLNELLTIGGTIIENLRWEKARRIKHIHWFQNDQEYHYHELKVTAK
ncbi:MAG: DEAD/DEAH box helicase [Candidatus Bathyarchaeota archaeon]|nr:DEAD/DEAH box helicase [Candidatus Termiticorpusculum sp.]